MKTMQELEHELLLKEQRVSYWERFHTVPKMSDLAREQRGLIL